MPEGARLGSIAGSRRRWIIAGASIGAVVGLGVLLIATARRTDRVPTKTEARRALLRGDLEDAERIAVAAGKATGDSECYLIAAEAAERRNRPAAALDYYRRVGGDDRRRGVDHLIAAGDALMRGRCPSDAEAKFRAALAMAPNSTTARGRLETLLVITGRRREAVPLLLQSVKSQTGTVHTLCLLAQAGGANVVPPQFKDFDEDATDALPLLAQARSHIEHQAWSDARRLLERALALRPGLVEADVALGQVLFESGDERGFETWAGSLSSAAEEHPESWYLRGMWAERHRQQDAAARAYWEAVRRDSEHRAAHHRLGRLLQVFDRHVDARDVLERAADLEVLSSAAEVLYRSPHDLDQMKAASDAAERLGRLWEARGWAATARRSDPDAAWAVERIRRLEPQLTIDSPQTIAATLPGSRIDLSHLPQPEIQRSRKGDNTPSNGGVAAIAFTDDATATGLDFTYWNGAPPGSVGKRMHEFTGGGVAVIDYDNDGRPDVFATQGGRFPAAGHGGESDQLFRNLGSRFVDVTDSSGSRETIPAFGQGVAGGDWDADGFADLYIANIGRNRLLQNNGDGTFGDVTEAAGLPDPPLTRAWTTSVLIADLSGDGLADLYDVNYVTADDVYERLCTDDHGQPRSCPPTEFEACPDYLLINAGNGRFDDRTAAAGMVAPHGNGLGVVAADIEGQGRLSVFVANDQTENHYFVRTSDAETTFVEQAVQRGLAFSGEGRPQACMGVAADDADGDGMLDLFVTNFYLEANTLYRQLPGALFEDATATTGLRDPSFRMLGFGTQFLDADLDGQPDLILTNGHIDDFSAQGIPYRMRPQFFQNTGGNFTEVPAHALGTFFETESLGRGLATLDWNGDGREDAVVTHLDTPLALLTNRSAAGNGLSISLVAVESERSAIGTIVTVSSTNGVRSRQLTGGDGYQSSNERRLRFGLGEADEGRAEVRWPSGRVESFGTLATGVEWLLIEGRGKALRLADHHPRPVNVSPDPNG